MYNATKYNGPPDPQAVAAWAFRELSALQQAYSALDIVGFADQSVAPARPRDGMFGYASATAPGWNPGSGKGFYAFFNGIWNRFGLKSEIDAASALAIKTVVQQIFTASGTYTPTAGMVFCIAEAVGGGGGGGGVAGNATGTNAGGGGAGADYARSRLTAAQIGASKAVTIGAGGAGGAAGFNNGSTGGDTSLGSLVIAKGGPLGPGTNALNNVGSGATANAIGSSTGDFTNPGGDGGNAFYSAGTQETGVVNHGGASYFGGGPKTPVVGTSSAGGRAGQAYGTGGSGGAFHNSAANAAGGAGRQGVLIITEFIA